MTPSPSGSASPAMFDAALTRARLERARRAGVADFLLQRCAEDLIERLSLVKRDFSAILDLGTPGPQATAALRAAYREAEVVHAGPLPAVLAPAPARVIAPDRLDLTPARHDLIVSLLALQHVDDLPGTLAQARAALKPDGLLLAAMVGGRSLHELRAALAQAEDEVRGGASPRVFPFVDLRDLGSLAQRAGLALPVADVETLSVRYADIFALMRDLRAMGATNALARRGRPLTREVLTRAAAIYAERFADPDGRVRATFEIVWLSGWAAHSSQQKPLRPGEGRTPLAAALAHVKAAREGGDI